jgi:leucyl/phenylalanyl-tRNA--protein transferase
MAARRMPRHYNTVMIPWLDTHAPFPPLSLALTEPNGLLAAGGELTAERLINAYRNGIFPWYSAGQPLLWWSPDPRMVLIPAELKISHSLGKRLRKTGQRDYEVRVDTVFETVMRACAAPREGHGGTWITNDMIAAYTALHRCGIAHSVETWINGDLAGGLYGVALGRMFYGESMFTRTTDASKIALAHLARQLHRWEFGLIDCQMNTAHLASLGGREIKRDDFIRQLKVLVNCEPPQSWQFDDDLFN